MDKRHLYENDIRVPFYNRGPDILPDPTTDRMVANIDIAPSILDIIQQSHRNSEI
jgi:arylsulfatase A-like enzyme